MKSGDDCHQCPIGMMRVYHTRKHGVTAIRYLRCDICRATGKQILAAKDISPRRTKQGTDERSTISNSR